MFPAGIASQTGATLIAPIPLLPEQVQFVNVRKMGPVNRGQATSQEAGNSDHRPDGNRLRSQKTHLPLWSRFQPI
jgi:hypothetical protein